MDILNEYPEGSVFDYTGKTEALICDNIEYNRTFISEGSIKNKLILVIYVCIYVWINLIDSFNNSTEPLDLNLWANSK